MTETRCPKCERLNIRRGLAGVAIMAAPGAMIGALLLWPLPTAVLLLVGILAGAFYSAATDEGGE